MSFETIILCVASPLVFTVVYVSHDFLIADLKEQCIFIKCGLTLGKTASEMEVTKMGFTVMTQKTSSSPVIGKPTLFTSKFGQTSRVC